MATQWTAGLSALTPLPAATLNTIGAAWETWTPVIKQPGVITTTISFARYARIQKIVVASFALTITGTGTAGQSLDISLPLTSNNTVFSQGSFSLFDTSATTSYAGSFYHFNTTNAFILGDWAANGVWGTVPNLAVANGDQFRGTMIYEAA